MPYHPPQSVMERSRVALSSLDPNRSLTGLELFMEHDKASLKPQGSDIVAGVSLELPEGFRAKDLLEAFRIGEMNCIAILEALGKMQATSSRPDRRFALDEALDHVADFSKIMLGIQCSESPERMSLSTERIDRLIEASADAIRYVRQEVQYCEKWDTDHLEFMQKRLEAHQRLNLEFARLYLKSIRKDSCEVTL